MFGKNAAMAKINKDEMIIEALSKGTGQGSSTPPPFAAYRPKPKYLGWA
ncbi:deoxyguanosinetriphosphate triphosphohydrolase [Shewanella decolorationis S12]|uniref:Deoxyguanosinetriphosphate triphosphohydrolase n=1 Tax=Shewanella decolorationis S12 TaxID=1353536 RepID=A0ABN0PMM1_9GAMM|nr:deoxyguanosinetriphosphate triphosphohydrolase [Shewanella decolorationis S12]